MYYKYVTHNPHIVQQYLSSKSQNVRSDSVDRRKTEIMQKQLCSYALNQSKFFLSMNDEQQRLLSDTEKVNKFWW